MSYESFFFFERISFDVGRYFDGHIVPRDPQGFSNVPQTGRGGNLMVRVQLVGGLPAAIKSMYMLLEAWSWKVKRSETAWDAFIVHACPLNICHHQVVADKWSQSGLLHQRSRGGCSCLLSPLRLLQFHPGIWKSRILEYNGYDMWWMESLVSGVCSSVRVMGDWPPSGVASILHGCPSTDKVKDLLY